MRLSPQYWLQRFITGAVGWCLHQRLGFLTRFVIRWFVARFDVDTAEVPDFSIDRYTTFNEFFIRQIDLSLRPLDPDTNAVVFPADGTVSAQGDIHEGSIFQAKGHTYTVTDLLAGDDHAASHFQRGSFMTLYLSPKDYHRVHMPLDGQLMKTVYVPGNLYRVDEKTVNTVSGVFAKNERVINYFDTQKGRVAMILVGARGVASVELVHQGLVSPPHGGGMRLWKYTDEVVTCRRGEEFGRFNTGSTVILLFPAGTVDFDDSIVSGTTTRVRGTLGRLK